MINTTIALITDSTSDLPAQMREQYQIRIVPLTIVWGDKQFSDGIDLTSEDFYRRLETEPGYPSTSQPTPQQFLDAYNAASAQGANRIVVITISGAMSGTLESARAAAQGYKIPVTIVDSKGNSMSLGWQVLAMARARETGANVSEMVQAANRVRDGLHYHIVLNTLEYLIKGGRIAGAAKMLGHMLNIKPQIRVNHKTGTVERGDISTTRKKAIDTLYSSFFKKLDTTKPMRIAVLHNAADEEAHELAERVKAEFNPEELIVGIVSPVLGTHTGPGALALCGYSES
jgi:DegV family protein with EDD domain